jgi:hypothetical protein
MVEEVPPKITRVTAILGPKDPWGFADEEPLYPPNVLPFPVHKAQGRPDYVPEECVEIRADCNDPKCPICNGPDRLGA